MLFIAQKKQEAQAQLDTLVNVLRNEENKIKFDLLDIMNHRYDEMNHTQKRNRKRNSSRVLEDKISLMLIHYRVEVIGYKKLFS